MVYFMTTDKRSLRKNRVGVGMDSNVSRRRQLTLNPDALKAVLKPSLRKTSKVSSLDAGSPYAYRPVGILPGIEQGSVAHARLRSNRHNSAMP